MTENQSVNTCKNNLLDLVRTTFSADHYAVSATGVEIDAVADHFAKCRLELAPNHRNARGAVMGGVLFTMADFGAAIAANTDCLDGGNLGWVSLNGVIHYLSTTRGERLVSETRCVKLGRTTALYRTSILDGDRLVAEVETTMVRVG